MKMFLKIFKKKDKKPNFPNIFDLNWQNPNDCRKENKQMFLAEFFEGEFKFQAIRYDSFGIGSWKHGNWSVSREIKKLLPIKDIPEEFWMSREENGYPPNNSLCLLSYKTSDHKEVAEYNNHGWTTELSFPCDFHKYIFIKPINNEQE